LSLKLLARVDGKEHILLVRDLSQTGFLAEATPPLANDQTVELELPHEGRKTATVVWAGEALAGCTFAGSISRATYSAALLKSQFLHPKSATAAQAPEAIPIVQHEEKGYEKLPMGKRAAVIAVGGALAWAPVLLIAYPLFG
jgi:hypothetical protein